MTRSVLLYHFLARVEVPVPRHVAVYDLDVFRIFFGYWGWDVMCFISTRDWRAWLADCAELSMVSAYRRCETRLCLA